MFILVVFMVRDVVVSVLLGFFKSSSVSEGYLSLGYLPLIISRYVGSPRGN